MAAGKGRETTRSCEGANENLKAVGQGVVIDANYYASPANSSCLTHVATLSVIENTPPQDLDELRLVFTQAV